MYFLTAQSFSFTIGGDFWLYRHSLFKSSHRSLGFYPLYSIPHHFFDFRNHLRLFLVASSANRVPRHWWWYSCPPGCCSPWTYMCIWPARDDWNGREPECLFDDSLELWQVLNVGLFPQHGSPDHRIELLSCILHNGRAVYQLWKAHSFVIDVASVLHVKRSYLEME